MNIASSILSLVGNTPLVRLSRLEPEPGAVVVGKLERVNPLGSIKERTALSMIQEAETQGRLQPGSVVVEPTSGNTGIALAMVCAIRGYRLMLTMPDSMSLERRQMLTALGAELVLTPSSSGMRGALEEAKRIASRLPNAFIPNQFSNPANPLIHENTTAREIWEDTEGLADAVIGGIGTGGTLTGIARFFAQHRPETQIIGVEPASSPFLTQGRAGRHGIQGIGAGFQPEVLQRDALHRVISISDNQAFAWMKRLARTEGLFCGPSSGAAVAAAMDIAGEPAMQGKLIVVILPDGGEKYLSSGVWGDPHAS